MGILDDTAIFVAVIQQGGFSHAAKHLGLSNGMVSRRIAQLEANLGVTLLQRTTRQIQLTPEGEVFWRHAQRIQLELDAAVSVIQSSRDKPKGSVRISAPAFFGAHYLLPMLDRFAQSYPAIEVDLLLSNDQIDPVRQQVDFVLRGSGYLDAKGLQDSSMRMKLLLEESIHLYASKRYLQEHGEPQSVTDLMTHKIIGNSATDKSGGKEKWSFSEHGEVTVQPVFRCNDVATRLRACAAGMGIAKFTDLNVQSGADVLRQVLRNEKWGAYYLYAMYPQQKTLPRRTRLLLDFIAKHTQNLQKTIIKK